MPTITISSQGEAGTNLGAVPTFTGIRACYCSEITPNDVNSGLTYVVAASLGVGDRYRSIVKFPGLSNIPVGSTVTAAALSVYFYSVVGPTNAASVYQILAATGSVGPTPDVSWSKRSVSGSANWTSNGGLNATDVNLTPLASLTGITSNSTQVFSGAAFTSHINSIVNGSTDNGIMMALSNDAAYDVSVLDGNGYGTENDALWLTVTYTAASGGTGSAGASIGGLPGLGSLLVAQAAPATSAGSSIGGMPGIGSLLETAASGNFGTLATRQGQTTLATGSVTANITGTLGTSQGQRTDAMGLLSITGTLGTSQGQRINATGLLSIAGALSTAQGQTTLATGTNTAAGAQPLATSQGQTTLAAGSVGYTGTLSTRQGQSSAAAGSVGYIGALLTGQAQTTLAVGAVTAAGVTGTLSARQGQSTLATGSVTANITGTLGTSQGQRTDAMGAAILAITGTLSTRQGQTALYSEGQNLPTTSGALAPGHRLGKLQTTGRAVRLQTSVRAKR